MSEHFVEKCSHCKTVMGQCRCPAKDKTVRWKVCDECAAKELTSQLKEAEDYYEQFVVDAVKQIDFGAIVVSAMKAREKAAMSTVRQDVVKMIDNLVGASQALYEWAKKAEADQKVADDRFMATYGADQK
jgi:hypothetical protein